MQRNSDKTKEWYHIHFQKKKATWTALSEDTCCFIITELDTALGTCEETVKKKHVRKEKDMSV